MLLILFISNKLRLLTIFLFVYFLAVVQCKLVAYTGVSGIMIRETAETFGIITQDNKFRGNPFLWKHFAIGSRACIWPVG